nr:hypothetical protein [Tanacetum cinerariifolium]
MQTQTSNALHNAIMEAGGKDHPPISQQAATRNRGKAIVNSPPSIYDQEPTMVAEDDEMSKDKEIDKLIALISLSFKKIYKPTNNNLRTSSNTSRANQDNSTRINRGTRDDTDDEPEDQELEAHYMYMAQIQEVTPDAANNSGRIFNSEPLQKDDDDDDDDDLANECDLLASLIEKLKCEIDDSKNRNKFLETSNKVLVDKLKDLKKFQAELDRYHDVKYASKVEIECAKAKGDLMSYKMESEKSFNSYTRKINDLNQTISEMKKKLFVHQETISILSQAKEAQLKFYKTREEKEIDKVIVLEKKIKDLDNIVYKTGQSVQTMYMLNRNCKMSFAKPEFLKKAQRANPRLYDIGCYNDNLALMLAPESDEVIRLEKESRSKLSDLIRPFDYEKLNNLYEFSINADLEKFHLCLKEKMVADLRYFHSLELEVNSLKSQLETQKTQFLNEIDRLSRDYYYADHMNAILSVYTEFDEVTNLQCDYLETLEKYECIEKELSKRKMMSTSFEALQKHAINLELYLQQCKEKIKNEKSFKENQSKEFRKEREQYFEIQDLKAQLQKNCNKAERLARNTNPLALVTQQKPVYHPQNHPTHYTQNSSTRSQQAATRNREKTIVNSPPPVYDQEPYMVAEDDEMSKDKEIDKLIALISLSFKKIYKPTNNNLLTSSKTSRVNQDNSPRINRGTGYDNQMIGNVAGARETVGTTLVQKSKIQCYNCKEYGHVARECQKLKRAKDAAYHKEKILLCKQEEAGFQLNAEQADWRDDTDEEYEDQELEAHYMYMAQIQEVT